MKKQNIQFLRMIACLMVFFTHFSQRMQFQGVWGKIGSYGAFGVQLFFIISGYLIANSYKEYAEYDAVRYVAKRMIRILPLYYCVIIYYFIVHTFLLQDVPIDETGFGWARYFLLLNKVVPITGTYFWDNLGITWTIPCFISAYLCLPILLKYIRNYWSAVLCCVGVWIFTSNLLWRLTNWFDVLYNLHYFLMGVVVYYSIRENKKILTTAILTLLLIYNALLACDSNIVASAVFMLLILWSENMHVEHPFLLKILKISDRYSYTMYLAHGMVFVHVMDRYHMGILRPFVAIIGTVIVTIVINHYAEMPVQLFLQKKMIQLIKPKTESKL